MNRHLANDLNAQRVAKLLDIHFGPFTTGRMTALEVEAEVEKRIAGIQCGLPSVEDFLDNRELYTRTMRELWAKASDISKSYLDRKAAKLARHRAILAVMAGSQRRAKEQKKAA